MKPLVVGLSSCFFHADPTRPLFKGKTLVYAEQSAAHWVMKAGVLAYLIPPAPPEGPVSLGDLVSHLDGVVLQGGSDVCPKTYGEDALKPEWNGDWVRDQYEIALVKECLKQQKPLLGICRGAQLLNVALGGTLYQDIGTQMPKARVHRDWHVYDQLFHEIRFADGSSLAKLYPGKQQVKVNSVHHQAVKDLGKELRVDATSVEDGVVEAISYTGPAYARALQWHPEFQDPGDKSLLDGRKILDEFLDAARRARC